MTQTDPKNAGLSDPQLAAYAWGRFRRIMAWMGLASALAVAAGLYYLHLTFEGPMLWPMIAAAVGGVGLSVLLGTALMGLVFLSAGTGHDEVVDRFNKDRTGNDFDND